MSNKQAIEILDEMIEENKKAIKEFKVEYNIQEPYTNGAIEDRRYQNYALSNAKSRIQSLPDTDADDLLSQLREKLLSIQTKVPPDIQKIINKEFSNLI